MNINATQSHSGEHLLVQKAVSNLEICSDENSTNSIFPGEMRSGKIRIRQTIHCWFFALSNEPIEVELRSGLDHVT